MEVSLSVFNIYLIRHGELVETGVLCGRSDIAKVADKVEFVMAGLPLTLKSAENISYKAPL
jgi:hypothetical protein